MKAPVVQQQRLTAEKNKSPDENISGDELFIARQVAWHRFDESSQELLRASVGRLKTS
jgi:hypothetical protein